MSADKPLPTPPRVSQDEDEDEQDGEEDLFGDDYLRDYQVNPSQDKYEVDGIDDALNPLQYQPINPQEESEFNFDDDQEKMEDEEAERDVLVLAQRVSKKKKKEREDTPPPPPIDQAFVKFLNLKGELDAKTFEYLILQNKLVLFLSERLVQSSIKEKFIRFLKTFKPSGKVQTIYMSQFKRLLSENSQSYFVDFQDFCEDLPYISSMYLDHPRKLQKLLNKFLNEFFFQLYPNYKGIWDRVFLRIIKLPVNMKIGDLRYFHMNNFISLKGIVIRRTKVYAKLSKYSVFCRNCKSSYGPYKEVKKWDKCPNPSCSQRNTIVKRRCKYKNFQKITMQETSQQVSAGRIPQNLVCLLKNDLINVLNPGDEVIVNGVLRIDEENFRRKNNLFFPLFTISSVEKKKSFMKIDRFQIRKLQRKHDLRNFLIKSFCPFIYKHDFIKLSLLLSLFGAESKDYRGHFIRGNINVLILGDPGTGKSQFLKYIEKIHPKVIYTTGRGSTGVGLTATVKLDSVTKEWTLEGGALVLADQGVCLIDEFDKMSPGDSTSLHEAMEQQTISISKAGIVTTLKARTTVIAVGNPKRGRYYSSVSFMKNCNIARSLLSRFDILIVVRDKIDEAEDKEMAEFVLKSHVKYHPEGEISKQTNEEAKKEEEIKNLMKNYIMHQRDNCNPIIKKEKLKKITDFYVELRKQAKEIPGGMQVAVRHLESIYRIAEAHARMLNHFQIEENDIDEAISVMLTSFLRSQKQSIRKRLERKFRKYLKN